ncbi:MAG: hypothetical protein IJT91_03405 [Clostridia bacterium]|nr:hypothetical protein [Clostridia bacterium]
MIDINYIRTDKRKLTNAFRYTLILMMISMLVLDPERVSRSVYGSVVFCGKTLIPSLFPMIVLSRMTVSSGLAGAVGKAFGGFHERLFGISRMTAPAFLTGLISGYPAGALCAVSLYEKGMITKSEAETALCFCSNTGMSFLVIGVGGMLGGAAYGIVLFAAQSAAAAAVGILFSRMQRRERGERKECAGPSGINADVSVFPEAIRSAVPAMFTVCGSVIFCSAFIDTALAPVSGLLPGAAESLIRGFFEMSRGIAAAASSLPKRASVPVIAALSAWSGASVHMQISAFTRASGLSLKKYYSAKAVTALLCPAAAYGLCRLFSLI